MSKITTFFKLILSRNFIFLHLAVKLAVKVKFVEETFTSELDDPDSMVYKNLTAKIEKEVNFISLAYFYIRIPTRTID